MSYYKPETSDFCQQLEYIIPIIIITLGRNEMMYNQNSVTILLQVTIATETVASFSVIEL